MSNRSGIGNYKRFPRNKDKKGRPLCRVCGKVVKGRRTSFCDHRCLRDFWMQTDWDRVRRVVFERDGGICMICGKKVNRNDYHVDHIWPISKGGKEWKLKNLQLSHPNCNLQKGAKYIEFKRTA